MRTKIVFHAQPIAVNFASPKKLNWTLKSSIPLFDVLSWLHFPILYPLTCCGQHFMTRTHHTLSTDIGGCAQASARVRAHTYTHTHTLTHKHLHIQTSSCAQWPGLTIVPFLFHNRFTVGTLRGPLSTICAQNSMECNRKLALVGIIPNQILFSFSSDKDRRTDTWIRRKNTARRTELTAWWKSKIHTQFPLWLRSSVVRACD